VIIDYHDRLHSNYFLRFLVNKAVVITILSQFFIQRLAALKKNGEEDWKKRNTTLGSHDNNNDEQQPLSNKINLVKQQKEQLQHQLQMAVPKPFSGGIPSKLVATSNDASSRSRLIKGTSNENLDDDTSVTKMNKNYSYSNESLDDLEATNLNPSQNQIQQRNKYVPIGKRVVLNPSDVINSNTGKITFFFLCVDYYCVYENLFFSHKIR